MTLPTPKELREYTEEAISNAKKEKEREWAAKIESERLFKVEQQNRAQGILASLPSKAYKAAKEGRTKVVLIEKLLPEDYLNKKPFRHTTNLTMDELNFDGACHVVATTCQLAGYEVRICYAHDGAGVQSWHELVIGW